MISKRLSLLLALLGSTLCTGGRARAEAPARPENLQNGWLVQVVDVDRRPIEDVAAEIVDSNQQILQRSRSNREGKVPLKIPNAESFKLRLSHPDFQEVEQEFRQPVRGETAVIILHPRPIRETVTVTATRTPQPLENVPARVLVVSRADLRQSPAVTLDDTLRQIPSFSLFRRTSSLVAHPTTQGVSLRGIGPSGVSRTLVLLDGIPLNDPFGGWVYWSQLDKNSLEQIEISPGGGSSLYGSSALGGVIQVLSRQPEVNRFELDVHGGSQATAGADFLGSAVHGPWSANFSGSLLHTDGYFVVAPQDRGLVDDRAGSVRYTLRAGGFYKPGNRSSAFLQASHFAEDRDNGTALQRNETDITNLRVSYRRASPNGREWQLRGHGLTERFFSNFTAVSADRQRETLTLDQTVPVRSAGGSAQWTGLLNLRHVFTAGVDWQWIRGNSEETSFAAGRASRFQVAGGSQQLGGIFVQDLFTPTSRWVIQLGARLDGWSNYRAARRELLLSSGVATTTPFVTQRLGTVNPKAGVSYRLHNQLTLRGSYYHSFRAPTLNELYRGFRAGNVVTNPNDQLGPEKLKGIEGGFDWRAGGSITGRVTGFWNQLDNAVANVTVSSLPTLITRRRENVGEIRAKGFETELAVRWTRDWTIRGAYLWSNSEIRRFPPNPSLESRRLPQVPRHRLTASLSYSNRILDAFVLARFVGAQFDDDLNLFPLGNFTVLDLHLSKSLHPSVRIYAAAENLFDRRFAVARTPIENIGAPRMVHAGLKFVF